MLTSRSIKNQTRSYEADTTLKNFVTGPGSVTLLHNCHCDVRYEGITVLKSTRLMPSCLGVSALVVVLVCGGSQTSHIPLVRPVSLLAQMDTMMGQGLAAQAGFPKREAASQMVVPRGGPS